MSEDKTSETLRLPSFQQRILTELETISSRLASVEKRAAQADLETKPNWERLQKDVTQIHADFVQLNTDMKVSFANLDRKLDVMNKEMFQVKADLNGVETRLTRIESEVLPQIIVQDRQF
jgi:hypothetical protein